MVSASTGGGGGGTPARWHCPAEPGVLPARRHQDPQLGFPGVRAAPGCLRHPALRQHPLRPGTVRGDGRDTRVALGRGGMAGRGWGFMEGTLGWHWGCGWREQGDGVGRSGGERLGMAQRGHRSGWGNGGESRGWHRGDSGVALGQRWGSGRGWRGTERVRVAQRVHQCHWVGTAGRSWGDIKGMQVGGTGVGRAAGGGWSAQPQVSPAVPAGCWPRPWSTSRRRWLR